MSLAKVISSTIIGLESESVEVEVDLSSGLPSFMIVGLPDKAVEEAKERVRSAIKNSGCNFPQKRITVNLAPADIKKEGPSYDLPIALSILLASEQVEFEPEKTLIVGELSLDGKLRHTNGILPMIIDAQKRGIEKAYLPEVNANEASIIQEVKIFPVKSLKDLIFHLRGEKEIKKTKTRNLDSIISKDESIHDFAYIKGQEHAKRALEIAASGSHNILLSGPPGAGKTLLAKALPTILPKMTFEEILEVTKIFSVAGLLRSKQTLISKRPFRNPHHTASDIALVGGGKWPKPGEISLAHRGILFLDEIPEFSRSVLEVLRQPLEDGTVSIARATGSLSFPAKFTLIATQNPCPCGFLTDPVKECTCSPSQILRYKKRVSGPLLDRIDLHVEVPWVKYEKLASEKVAESSSLVQGRVQKARDIQEKRFKNLDTNCNSEMRISEIKKFCPIDEQGKNLLRSAVNQINLSARSFHKIIKIARTIADLSLKDNISTEHLAEALQYRQK